MLILRYNKLFNFVVGNRGGGKTYGCKKWCIKDFLKTGNQFVWVRRYKSELKKINMFFVDILEEFPGVKLEVKGNTCLINGAVAGWFIPLSTALTEKSNSYPNVTKIVFDEFVIDKGMVRYLPNECECFLELYETIARTREVKAVFLSNAVTVVNPYFLYFNIYPKNGTRFTVRDDIVIDVFTNDKFVEKKHESRFGKVVSNTNYSRYAIDNEFLRDNSDFIDKERPVKTWYEGSIKYSNQYFGVYWDYNNNRLWVCKKKNGDSKTYAVTTTDMDANTILLKNQSMVPMFKKLKMAFGYGLIWYDDIKTKNQFYEIIKILSIG